MKILYGKSKWEMMGSPLETFLLKASEDGFDAVEIYMPALAESPETAAQLAEDHSLKFIAQIITDGHTPSEHLETLRARFDLAVRTRPLLINSHTGRDHFSFEDNLQIFKESIRLSRESGIPIVHETHRGRPLFAAHETRRYLEALPELLLNADFSHWFCVHESDLSDQPAALEAAIGRVRYIHARVGFEEGPQVGDPLAEWMRPTLDKFLALWRRILSAQKAAGTETFVITPEFGPPPYMPCHPQTGEPLCDAWEVNVRFFKALKEKFADFAVCKP